MEHEELRQGIEDMASERETGSLSPERETGKLLSESVSGNETDTASVACVLSKLHARLGLGNSALAHETSVEVVRDALAHQDWRVRTAAARRLGEIGNQADVALLVQQLEKDSVGEVRAASARALSAIQGAVPELPLLTALKQDDEIVREAVVLALGAAGTTLSQVAIDTLEDAFYDEPSENTRATIVSVLGQLGERSPLELLSIALQDVEWVVREAAVLAMGKQKGHADIAALEAMLYREVRPVHEAVVYVLKHLL